MRAKGEESRGRNERRTVRRHPAEAAQINGRRIRGPREGGVPRGSSDRQESRDLALRAYDVTAHPYAQGTYDRKAPAGYVRYSEDPRVNQLARASSTEVRYTTAFSDENTGACVVM